VSTFNIKAEIMEDFMLFVGLAKSSYGNNAVAHSFHSFRFSLTSGNTAQSPPDGFALNLRTYSAQVLCCVAFIISAKGKEKVKRMVKKD